MTYRAVIDMLVLCGCAGVGGWPHYVGQEKLRPQVGSATPLPSTGRGRRAT
jgi:nitrate reductase alpha subunit